MVLDLYSLFLFKVCEQVSHHPPISAYYAESIRPLEREDKVRWKYYGSVNPFMKINFLHACVEAYPEGIQTVELPEHGETYTWHNLKVTAHNIVLGKMWFENTGRVELVNHKLNLKCVMEFKPYSWFSKQFNRVEGYIVDESDTKVALLNGKSFFDGCLLVFVKMRSGLRSFSFDFQQKLAISQMFVPKKFWVWVFG